MGPRETSASGTNLLVNSEHDYQPYTAKEAQSNFTLYNAEK